MYRITPPQMIPSSIKFSPILFDLNYRLLRVAMYKNIPIPEFSSIAFTILKHTAIIITGFPKISWIELEPLGPSLQFLMPSSRSESRGVPSPRDFWRIARMVSGKTEAIVVERRPITRNWYWKIVAQIPRRH